MKSVRLLVLSLFLVVLAPSVLGVGYEFLNGGEVVHAWNGGYDFYFNLSNGVQLTNHYDEYWTRNVFCGGRWGGSSWLDFCADSVPFSWSISSGASFFDLVGTYDVVWAGKSVRFAVDYHLDDSNDTRLKVNMSFVNIGKKDVPESLRFGWRVNDVRVAMSYLGNEYFVKDLILDAHNLTNPDYDINMSVAYSFVNMSDTSIVARLRNTQEYLGLWWSNVSDNELFLDNGSGEYNAPFTIYTYKRNGLLGYESYNSTYYWIDALDTKLEYNEILTNPVSTSYTVGSGATLLVLGVFTKTSTQRNGGAPSYNGVNLTEVFGYGNTGGEGTSSLWYMAMPPEGSHTISVPNTGTDEVSLVISSYKDTPGYQFVLTNYSSAWNSGSANPSTTVYSPGAGSVLVDAMWSGYKNVASANTYQLLYKRDTGNEGYGAQYNITTSSGNKVMGWTQSSDGWQIVAGVWTEILIPTWTQQLNLNDTSPYVGETVKFNASGSASTNYNLLVCGSSGQLNGACTGTQLCNSSSVSSGSQASCNYAVTTAGTITGYGYLCNTYGLCSNVTSKSYTSSYLAGWLNVSLLYPTGDLAVNPNSTFWLNATVTCNGGVGAVCGTVYGYARYNKTSTPDTLINTTSGATPLFLKIVNASLNFTNTNLPLSSSDNNLSIFSPGAGTGVCTVSNPFAPHSNGVDGGVNEIYLDYLNYSDNNKLLVSTGGNTEGEYCDVIRFNSQNMIGSFQLHWVGYILTSATNNTEIRIWNESIGDWSILGNKTTINTTMSNYSWYFDDVKKYENGSYIHILLKGGTAVTPTGGIYTDYIEIFNQTNSLPQSSILTKDKNMNVSWLVNYTAGVDTAYLVDVLFNSSQSGVAVNSTGDVLVYNVSDPPLTNFSDNLRLYLNMDENVLDWSVYKNNGSVSGATYSNGFFNESTYYGGDGDYVSVPDDGRDPYDGMPEITINFWANESSAMGSSRLAHMNGVWSVFSSAGATDDIRWRVYNTSGSTNECWAVSTVTYNDWQMITVTYKSGNQSIYYDGSYVTSCGTLTGGIRDLGVPVYLGLDEDLSSYPYTGQLDEVAIWNYSMTPGQISELYDRYTVDGWALMNVSLEEPGCVTPSGDAGGYYTPTENETWCTGTYALRLNFTSSNLYINLNGSTLDCTGYQNCVEWYYLGNLDNNTLDCGGGKLENFEYHGVYLTSQSNQESNHNTVRNCEITSTLMSSSGGSAIENVGANSVFENLWIHDVNNDTSVGLPPHGIYLSDGSGAGRKSLNATIRNCNLSNIGANAIKTNDGQGTTINNTRVYNVIINGTGLAGAGGGLDINAEFQGLFENISINNSVSYCINVGGGSTGDVATNSTNFTNVTCDNSGLATINIWNASNVWFVNNTYVDDVTVIQRNKPISNIMFNESTGRTVKVSYSSHALAGSGSVLFNYSARKDFNYSQNVFDVLLSSPWDDLYNVTGAGVVASNINSYELVVGSNEEYVFGDFVGCITPSGNSAGWYTPSGNETWCTGSYSLRVNVSMLSENSTLNLNGSTLNCSGYSTCVDWFLGGGTAPDNVVIDCGGGVIKNWNYTGVTISGKASPPDQAYNITLTGCELTSPYANMGGGAGILNYGNNVTLMNLWIHDVYNDTVLSPALPNHGIYISDGSFDRKSRGVVIHDVNISGTGANGINFNDGQVTTINNSHVYDVIINNTGVAGAGSGLNVNSVLYGLFEDIIINNTASYCVSVGGGENDTPIQFTNFTNVTCDNNVDATLNFWNASNVLFSGNNYLDDVFVKVRNKPIKNIRFNESSVSVINVTFIGHSLAGNGYVLFNVSDRKSFNFTDNRFHIFDEGYGLSLFNGSNGSVVNMNFNSVDFSLESNGFYFVNYFIPIDLSFSVGYPSSGCSDGDGRSGAGSVCEYCSFSMSSPDDVNRSCTGQNSSLGFYLFMNTGNVGIDVVWGFNESLGSGLSSVWDLDGDPAGATGVAVLPATNTLVTGLIPAGEEEVWLWGSVSSGLFGNYSYVLNQSSSES